MDERDGTIRIAAIDESELMLLGLQTVLWSEGGIEVVFTTTSLEHALGELGSTSVDGVLFSAGASRRDTVERCEAIRAAAGERAFLCLLSPTADEQLLFDVSHAGVRGFLVRDVPAASLGTAVRLLSGGESYIDPSLASRLFALVRASQDEALENLTATERTILLRLGEGLSNAEIAARVFLSEKTVRNYVSRLLRKLNLSSRAEAAAFGARGEVRNLDQPLLQIR